MAFLKLSDSAFGTVGLTITEAINLNTISQQISSLLGMPFSFDSLDVSAVTRTGLTATGLGVAGSRLTVGDYLLFDPLAPISGFEILALTEQTIATHGATYDVRSGGLWAAGADFGLDFGADIRTLDFSATGTANLDILIDGIAPLDTAEVPGGYRIIGNDAANVFYGFTTTDSLAYFGSNSFDAAGGDDVIFGGQGNDTAEGGAGNDRLFGDQGDDSLYGNLVTPDAAVLNDNDILFGGFGVDRLEGGPGNDWLFAGQEADSLNGGDGRDRFLVVENFDISSGVLEFDFQLGEEVEVLVNTGFGVAFVEAPNVIEDFTVGDDLLVFGLDDQGLINTSGNVFVDFDAVNSVITLDNFSVEASFTIADTLGDAGETDLLFRVSQSEGLSQGTQQLDYGISRPDESTFDGSFEVVYTSAAESSGFDPQIGVIYDTYSQLQVTPTAVSGVRAGQDKFDFTDLDLGSADQAAVEDILFTTVEDYGPFTVESFNDGDPEEADFFFDADAGVDRALRVEFDVSFGGMAVYVDANLDGNYNPLDDLAVVVESLQDGNDFDFFNGNTGLYEITKTDLYNPNPADGSAPTGIFIFDEDQYEFWFNDVAPPEQIG